MANPNDLVEKLKNYAEIERDIIEIRALTNMSELEALTCIIHNSCHGMYTWDGSVELVRDNILKGFVWDSTVSIWRKPNYNEKTPTVGDTDE